MSFSRLLLSKLHLLNSSFDSFNRLDDLLNTFSRLPLSKRDFPNSFFHLLLCKCHRLLSKRDLLNSFFDLLVSK